MHTTNQLLAARARQEDLLRAARSNHLATLIGRCGRKLLGFLPITRPCAPAGCC
jgi:hypothetical protein